MLPEDHAGESPEPTKGAPQPAYRDLLELGQGSLSALEKAQIRFVRRTFAPGPLGAAASWYQREFGTRWVSAATNNLREFHGLDRVPRLGRGESLILVSNHRSFFDMYVLSSQLIRRHELRLIFPVRSKFFYDTPAGLIVNGLMSAFSMYPPIFRERSRAALNVASLDETIRVVRAGGAFLGMHPEGKRNTGPDPYTLLPAQRGVGRILHECPNAKVVPVFINGLLTDDLPRQIMSNFDGTGQRVIAVFGEPIDFSAYYKKTGSPKLHKELAEISMEHVRRLSHEERTYRAQPKPR